MKRLRGYARIMYGDAGIYFRLENVSQTRFRSLLDLFLARFPVRVWNDQKRAWQLPHKDANLLIEFAEETFGKDRIVIDRAYQMALPLHSVDSSRNK
jgi:hypothetical protein